MVDIQEIQRLLPHRYPFLLVDRVQEFEANKSIVALKNVTMNEQFFQGHFPGDPVVPGVLMIEGLAQAGALLEYLSHPENQGRPVYFLEIEKARFRKPVRPGDQMLYHLSYRKRRGDFVFMSGKIMVDQEVVVEADVAATFAD